MYLFDAQNRWGYEAISLFLIVALVMVYLFDAQNRWGYENKKDTPKQTRAKCIYSMLRIVGVMSSICL